MSEIKALSGVEIKSATEGKALVRFATYNEIDHHGDITRKGAFEDGQQVVISAYNHQSWGGSLPVGKGVIRDGGDGPYGDLQFFMNTAAGRETFETVKELGPLQQWSYGFDLLKKSTTTIEDEGIEKSVRVIEKVKVHEISPVLLGAGKSTATVGVKVKGLDEMSLDDLMELLEERLEKAKKPKPDQDDNSPKKPSSKNPSSGDDDDVDEDDDDKKKPGRGKKPPKSGKMRMSDQTEDVVTSLKDLADRAEEIVALRKSEGKANLSAALTEQFRDLLKQADRIFALCPQDDEGFFLSDNEDARETKAANEQAEAERIYLSLLSEEL